MEPRIYFFDMDHTLQDNDSDVSWKQFLIDRGLAPAEAMDEVDFFFEQYKRGELNIDDFLRFQLREFVGRTPEEMRSLVEAHFQAMSLPRVYPAGRVLTARLLAAGKPVYLLTATNRHLAAPFAAELGLTGVLATELELAEGRFTGIHAGEYCAGPGKIIHAEACCRNHGLTLADAAYYGDSIADRYLLEKVGFPTAVNPSPSLREIAVDRGWPILQFAPPE